MILLLKGLAKATAAAARINAATKNRTVSVLMIKQINAICFSATKIDVARVGCRDQRDFTALYAWMSDSVSHSYDSTCAASSSDKMRAQPNVERETPRRSANGSDESLRFIVVAARSPVLVHPLPRRPW